MSARCALPRRVPAPQAAPARTRTIHPRAAVSTAAMSTGALPADLIADLERKLGSSFGNVRIHASGGRSRDVADAGALAITRGDEIAFAPGRYRPDTLHGRALIAHELTHVAQQRRGALGNHGAASALECEAQAVEQRMLSAQAPALVSGRAPISEQRSESVDIARAMRAYVSGGIESVADLVASQLARADPLIRQLADLRAAVRARAGDIVLDSHVVLALQSLYLQLRAAAPSWLPIPDVQFRPRGQAAAPLIVVAGVALGAAELLLLLGIVLVLLWWISLQNPEIRRSHERAVQDLINSIRELILPRRSDPWPPPIIDVPPAPDAPPVTDAPPIADAPPVPDARPSPDAPPAPDVDTVPDVDTAPDPAPHREPERRPRPRPPTDPHPAPRCRFPTGLTRADPIPMTWHKPRIDNFYPRRLQIGTQVYGRDDPANPRHLARGEPIGVPERYWPRVGKVMQLVPVERGRGAADYRAVLARYGFDWSGLQADHVQDVEWSGPDDFTNLWPMSSDANGSAGPRQNQHQRVSYCETPTGPAVTGETLQVFKSRPGRYGRYFRIAAVGI